VAIHNLSVSRPPMFLLNSRSSLVTATRHPRVWHPFSRSYGASLPNSLARILADTPWASHPGAPVSVLGTIASCHLRYFTGHPHRKKPPRGVPAPLPPVLTMTVLPRATGGEWAGVCPLSLVAGVVEDALTLWSRNINRVSFREFRLRTHLGSTNPRRMIVAVEPWPLRRTGFSPVFAATPPRIFDGTRSIGAHAPTSTRAPRLLTRSPRLRRARISGAGLAPSIFGAHALDW
jgi:hypothetical protein